MWCMNVYKKARYDKIWSFPFKFVTHEMLSKVHKMPKNSSTLIIITQIKEIEGGLAIEEYSTWRIEERASLFEWWVYQPYKKPLPISKEDKLRKQNRELIPTLGTKNTDPVNKLYRTWKWNIVKIKSTVTLHMYNIYWPLATKGIHVISLQYYDCFFSSI